MEQFIPVIVAIVLAVVAWKILKGIVKVGAIVALLAGGAYLYSQGYLT